MSRRSDPVACRRSSSGGPARLATRTPGPCRPRIWSWGGDGSAGRRLRRCRPTRREHILGRDPRWSGLRGRDVAQRHRRQRRVASRCTARTGSRPPDWPDGAPQQIYLDLHVDDPHGAHEAEVARGARLLQPAQDLDADEGHQVYADPAGHPFCIGWGTPSREALAAAGLERRMVRGAS